MINKKCFTTEWINTKSIELNYSDKNLIEKVIRAFSLLDMLASSGCPFYFKGGSSLMLMFNEGTHRLSIDIDIMCPPGTDIEKYLSEYANNGFISYQLIERKQAGKQVPKEHSKFFYKVALIEPYRLLQ
ncbi:MAG: nucleotidyl transferase AbiEii/AbiGii toxin family protein [Paludibacteraceae bacterium]|nr:nucleotidyl transferase AbiEii/AbiGii toxin family protein [Paludibacteraceae bacterium]